MCGIAGFWGKGKYDTGRDMIQSIRYRGPDFQGVFFQDTICLAQARLSIIDLDSRSNQPFFNAARTLSMVFNGEIYNYLEIKKDLLSTGKYTFSTTSDTEALLYAYEEYGKGCLQKIQGMFAFAIYDFGKEELFIAKDRMGKKPFYYSLCPDGTFVFASEIKAILKHPSVKKELNIEAVNQYLTFDYVPTPLTINSNVFKLGPAQYMIIRNEKIVEKGNYWTHNFTTDRSISFDQALTKFDHLLDAATACRLMSDVPLGVFLSGGLDSSTVAYYAQKNSAQKIKTFSIGFEDKSYDEQDYALQVAKHLGTDHHLKVLTPAKTIDLIEVIFPLMDEPFADASIIPTYYLSEFTRQQVTVALGGDGSDEMLAGYPTFLSDKFKSPLQYFPKGAINFFIQLANLLPSSDKNISFDFKIKQYLRGFKSKENHIHQLWLGSFLPEEKKLLFNKNVLDSLCDKTGLNLIDKYFKNDIADDFNKVTNYYYQTYLPDDILVKVDRASMYNSLEVRTPFLDKSVVEFLNSLPKKYKQKGFEGKYLLKKMMEDKLPRNIVYRSKKGFGIPLSDWIRKDLRTTIHETLMAKDDLFNSAYIEKLLDQHYSAKYNHRKLIWNLYVLKRFMIENKYVV
jgi:asparagine synthase (glutamine-hydrolysing)